MGIPPKKGSCIDCENGTDPKYLMAKRCIVAPNFHYQKHQADKYRKRLSENKLEANLECAAKNDGMTVSKWYSLQINLMPHYCEECGSFLNKNAIWGPHSYVAHIVPKELFSSVKVDLMNRVFLCIDCHANYDRMKSEEIKLLFIYPRVVNRFKTFMHRINTDEISKLLPCFYDVYNEQT